MKVWRVMVVVIHPDDDAEETTEFRHSAPLRAVRCRRRIPVSPRESIPPFRGRETLDVKGETLGVRGTWRDERDWRDGVSLSGRSDLSCLPERRTHRENQGNQRNQRDQIDQMNKRDMQRL